MYNIAKLSEVNIWVKNKVQSQTTTKIYFQFYDRKSFLAKNSASQKICKPSTIILNFGVKPL